MDGFRCRCSHLTGTTVRIGWKYNMRIAASMRTAQIDEGQTKRKGVAKVLYGSGPVTKKISKKTLIKHRPGDRFDDLMRGEFFNGAFKKSLLVSHEWPTRKQLFPPLMG